MLAMAVAMAVAKGAAVSSHGCMIQLAAYSSISDITAHVRLATGVQMHCDVT